MSPPSPGARLATLASGLMGSLLLAGGSAGIDKTRVSSFESHADAARLLIEAAIGQETKVSGQLAGAGSASSAKARIGAAVSNLDHAESEVRLATDAHELTELMSSVSQHDLQHAIHLDVDAKLALTGGKRHAAIEDLNDAAKYKHSALEALPAAPADPVTYTYSVKIEVSATGDSFARDESVPGLKTTYRGSMSASFTIMFDEVFTLSRKAGTVDAESQDSTGGSGTASFTLTAMDPPMPPNTCTVPAHTPFKTVGGLAPSWGGGPSAKSYQTGEMLFAMGFEPDIGSNQTKLYPCSASTPGTIINATVEAGYTVPGMNLQYVNLPPSTNPAYPNPGCVSGELDDIYLPIPISDLGKQDVTTTFRPGPIACQPSLLDTSYTAHVVESITLHLEGTS